MPLFNSLIYNGINFTSLRRAQTNAQNSYTQLARSQRRRD